MEEKKVETPDAQMRRLKIVEDSKADDEAAFLEEAIKLAAAEKEALKAEKEAKQMRTKQCHHVKRRITPLFSIIPIHFCLDFSLSALEQKWEFAFKRLPKP